MGTLHADVNYDNALGHINIDAIADDGPGRQTVVKGYIAPKDDDILLTINADGTRMDFLEDFTDSFPKGYRRGLARASYIGRTFKQSQFKRGCARNWTSSP